MPNSLRELADRYWQLVCEETPAAALMAGQPTGFALLRESPEDHARRLAGPRLGYQSEAAHFVANELRSFKAIKNIVDQRAGGFSGKGKCYRLVYQKL